MLDPASSVEMVKVLEEDPMVGGVGGDVQVGSKSVNVFQLFASENVYSLNCTSITCRYLIKTVNFVFLSIDSSIDP